MITVEADTAETVTEQPPGSRFYVVAFLDGQTGLEGAAGTSLDPDDLETVDRICAVMDVPFHQGVLRAAAKELAVKLWGDEPPEGTEIRAVVEVSRRELLGLMEKSAERLTGTVGEDAS